MTSAQISPGNASS